MSLDSPSQEEKAWMADIVRLGCIICYMQGHPGTPASVHHMLSGGRRISHLKTLPLCDPGHHKNGDGVVKVSRHPWRSEFEKTYKSEAELLELTRDLVSELRNLTV